METSGLTTSRGVSIPLLGVRVDATVVGGHTRVRLRQRYKNAESTSVEAVYVFPVPSDASVCGFAMICEGRRLEGVVLEREQAFKNYDEALVQGHGASLLEEERKNVFTASVGNLLPNEETLIEIEYVQPLAADEGALRWMLPTLVAPRYVPGQVTLSRTAGGHHDPTDRVPDADRITPHIDDVSYGLALTLTFDLGAPLIVESPSHHVSTRHDGTKAVVTLSQGEVGLDRDIVVTARGVDGGVAGVAAHRTDDKPGYFSLSVVADLFDPAAKAEAVDVVFLVDTSGSMDGESLPQAKNALRLCLRHLRDGDRFNVIHFDTQHRAMKSGPVAFTEKTLREADAWIERLQADGGTELLAPLLEAVSMAPDGIVVLLTDGQVANENEILEAVMHKRKTTRIYNFGIGTNISDQLLRDLSRRSGGDLVLIHPGERIDTKVTATFAKAFAQRVGDVKLAFSGVEVGELAPAVLPPLIDGEPWSVFGRYAVAGKGHAEITGTHRGAPFRLSVPVDLPAHAELPALRALWATQRVRDLGESTQEGRRGEAMKARIVALAVEHRVSSPYTAFLVVEQRAGDRLTTIQAPTRFIPVAAPAGWAMFDNVGDAFGGGSTTGAFPIAASARLGGAPMAPPPPAPMAAPKRARSAKGGMLGLLKSVVAPIADTLELRKEAAAPASEAPADPIAALLMRQLASGLWQDGDDARSVVRATTAALLTLLKADVTTGHAVYGGQVRKAVEALVDVLTRQGSDAAEAAMALSVAWLVTTGARTRARISAASQGHPGLSGRLADEVALRASVLA